MPFMLSRKFRETELRIRHQLEDDKKPVVPTSGAASDTDALMMDDGASSELVRVPTDESDFPGAIQAKYLDDASGSFEDSIKTESLISLTVAKQEYAEVLQQEMEDEYNRGLLISKVQYDQLRYEDENILALRNAKVKFTTSPLINNQDNVWIISSQNIIELYQLAEKIITGGEVAEEPDEEGEGEDEDDAIDSQYTTTEGGDSSSKP